MLLSERRARLVLLVQSLIERPLTGVHQRDAKVADEHWIMSSENVAMADS